MEIEVNIQRLAEQFKQLEGKLSQREPMKLPNLGVLAIGGIIAMSPFPWVHDLVRRVTEFEEEQARERILKG